MAIYHLEAKVVSRGSGRSAVAASAYLSCSNILNDYDGVRHDYTRKKGLVWQEIFLPKYAPAEWQDRGVLWNAVEENEKTKDSRLAREFVPALPVELNKEQWQQLLSDFINEQFVSDGMCADVAIHDPHPHGHNPHAHIMLTVRPLDENGKWQYKTEKEYLCIKDGEKAEPENPYRWGESSVVNILERMEYIGATVNFKTYTNSIWDKKQRENPMENQKIFYNTHPAIITQEVFDKVQEIRQQRHRRTATGKSSMFSGLVFCADCKQKLYYSTTSYFEKRQDFFICSTHRGNKDKCSGHYIRAVSLESAVWKHMKEVISYVSCYEAHFRVEMEQKLRLQSEETIRVYKKRLAQAEKRIGELDRLFIKIYEDNAKGALNDDRFNMMSKVYEDEQAQLKIEVKNLQREIEVQEQQIENLEQFIQRVRRYTTLTELTPYALRELVKAVYVEAPDKSSGKRKQKVHIEYDLVGYIPVDELIKAEQA